MGGAELADKGLGGSSLGSAPSQADPWPGPPGSHGPYTPEGKAGPASASVHGEAAVQNLPLETHVACRPGVRPRTTPFTELGGAANRPYPTTQASSQAACSCGLPHRTGATAPSPHLQPSSSSSWPLPHVWFPLATRQTLGVALPSGGGPPSALPPSFLCPQARMPGSGPSDGGAPSTQRPLPRLRGRLRQGRAREVQALAACDPGRVVA